MFHNYQIRNCLFYSDCHLLIFCETFFNSTDSSENYQLPGYQMRRYDYSRRTVGHTEHTGMCVYTKYANDQFHSASVIIRGAQFVYITITQDQTMRILAVHRRPSATSLSDFLLAMNESLNSFDADIVVGDVNVNMPKSGKSLEELMRTAGYTRHSHLFTTKYYTEIDVVFSKRELKSSTLETVFSVHLPIFIEID